MNGSESLAELSLMQAAVEEFRRAAEMLAGQTAPSLASTGADGSREVVPPRAADETPRQYAERLGRMTARFRSLAASPGRDRGAR